MEMLEMEQRSMNSSALRGNLNLKVHCTLYWAMPMPSISKVVTKNMRMALIGESKSSKVSSGD